MPAQTQSSIAASADGEHWVIFNASPDIRQQIQATPALRPRAGRGLRDSPIAGVVLTNADIDHVAGLLILREKQAFDLWATRTVHDVLARNPIFNALDPELVARRPLELGTPQEAAPGLEVELFAVPGKVALYLEADAAAASGGLKLDQETEDTVAVRVRSRVDGAEFIYAPACARLSDDLAGRLRGAELVFFDGTVWRDDEMRARGVGRKTGARMGHMHMAGEDGAMAALGDLDIARKVFIHINNTNPVLRHGSPERAEAEAAGWTIAEDGMVFEL